MHHGSEQHWVDDAILTNWVSTVGANINEVEKQVAQRIGVKYAVALSCGTAALHLATKLAGERLYGQARPNQGTLQGHRVFCSDMTFDASINLAAYEDGEAVFIDTERDTWNMDPVALEKAFELYPEVRLMGGCLIEKASQPLCCGRPRSATSLYLKFAGMGIYPRIILITSDHDIHSWR